MFSEDLMHIFWLCKHVQTFWNTVTNWIFFKTKIRLQVNAQTIILGNPNYSKKDSVVNLIILFAKHIYISQNVNSTANVNWIPEKSEHVLLYR